MGFFAKLMESHNDGGTDYNKFTLLSDDESTDATIADYVVEQGTDGDWTYRKWNSGVAECWKVWYSGSFAPTAQVGSYWYRVTNGESLPTDLFISTPVGHFDLTYWGTGVFWGNVRNVTTTTYRLTLFRNDNASSEGWGALSFKGKWK